MWPLTSTHRTDTLPHSKERILVIGASAGVGLAIAHQYSAKGARVCVVGRSQSGSSGEQYQAPTVKEGLKGGFAIMSLSGDPSVVDDMLRVRDTVQKEWDGIDTLVLCSGTVVSGSFMETAGVQSGVSSPSASLSDKEGIEKLLGAANSAVRDNYLGPVVAAATFIPLLSSSVSSAVMHVSTLSAVVALPTLSLYSSTKMATLALYQALAAENPHIHFTLVLQAVIHEEVNMSLSEGEDFEKVSVEPHGPFGLTREGVAERCIQAVDGRERTVYLSGASGRLVQALQWYVPGVLARWATQMYTRA